MELEKKFAVVHSPFSDEPFSALKLVLGSSWTLCNMFGGYSAKLCVLGWSSKKYLECRSFITYFTDLTVWVESVSSTRSRGMKQLCNSVDASYGHCRGSQGWTFSHFKNSKQNDVWMLQMLGHFQDVAEVVKVNIATTNISSLAENLTIPSDIGELLSFTPYVQSTDLPFLVDDVPPCTAGVHYVRVLYAVTAAEREHMNVFRFMLTEVFKWISEAALKPRLIQTVDHCAWHERDISDSVRSLLSFLINIEAILHPSSVTVCIQPEGRKVPLLDLWGYLIHQFRMTW